MVNFVLFQGMVIKPIYRLPVCPRDQVPVSVCGDLDGMMPQLLFYVGERFPVSD
jgi:hypothetical protein